MAQKTMRRKRDGTVRVYDEKFIAANPAKFQHWEDVTGEDAKGPGVGAKAKKAAKSEDNEGDAGDAGEADKGKGGKGKKAAKGDDAQTQ